jgi:RimJ/RimL family protein N-acetyltransferase
VLTERLEVRLPTEADRARFVELFSNERFMEFSAGVLDPAAASRKFDRMLERTTALPFAKQPVVERSTGIVVGYVGMDPFDFEGEDRLEFGWRLAVEARGKGYATEASRALLDSAALGYSGEVLAIIDPTNVASLGVARKLGFTFWKEAVVGGFLDGIYRLRIGEGGA